MGNIRLVLRFLNLAAFFIFLPLAHAANGILDDVILSSSKLDQATLLLVSTDGQLHSFPAQIMDSGDIQATATSRETSPFLLAARVDLTLFENNIMHDHEQKLAYVFIANTTNGKTLCGQVKTISWGQLRATTDNVETLRLRTKEIVDTIPEQRGRLAKLEVKLQEVKNKASKIAGVDDILDLRSELQNLKSGEEGLGAEVTYLGALVKSGRQELGTEAFNNLRVALGDQLREIALTTAGAERMSNTKRESALENYQRKLELIRETEDEDLQALAQTALDLRRERQDLESRIGNRPPISPRGEEPEF